MAGLLLTFAADVAVNRLAAYSAALPPIYAAHGGRYLGLGGPGRGVEAMGGAPPRSLMLARFPSLVAVHRFWNSSAYRAAVPLRAGCGQFTVFALEADLPAPPVAMLLVPASPAGLLPAATLGPSQMIEGETKDMMPLKLFLPTNDELTPLLQAAGDRMGWRMALCAPGGQ